MPAHWQNIKVWRATTASNMQICLGLPSAIVRACVAINLSWVFGGKTAVSSISLGQWSCSSPIIRLCAWEVLIKGHKSAKSRRNKCFTESWVSKQKSPDYALLSMFFICKFFPFFHFSLYNFFFLFLEILHGGHTCRALGVHLSDERQFIENDFFRLVSNIFFDC